MKKSIRVSAALLAAAAALAVLLVVGLSNKSILSPRATAQEDPRTEEVRRKYEQRRRLHAMPEIVNATSSLRVVSAEIEHGSVADDLLVTLRNDSPKSMISFTFCFVEDEEEGYSSMSIGSPSEDLEALAPYAETTVRVDAGSITPGKPLSLCAVMFSDETQEGVGHVVESFKQSRDKAKGRRPNQ